MFSLSRSTPSIQRLTGMPVRFHHRGVVERRLEKRIGNHSKVFFPNPCPVCPSRLRTDRSKPQRIRQKRQIGRALHVVVATENVGAAASRCPCCQRASCQDAVGGGCCCYPLLCCVPPMQPDYVPGGCCPAYARRRSSCEPGAPVTRSTSSVSISRLRQRDLVHARKAVRMNSFVPPTRFSD